MNIKEQIIAYHRQLFGSPSFMVAAPGRVNIIGEHTDYNGGKVLPYALDRHIYLTASLTGINNELKVYAVDKKRYVDFASEEGQEDWCDFFHSVRREISPYGELPGMEVTLLSDLPSNAGLSSSSALTCGIIYLYDHFMELGLTRDEMIRMASRAEHGVGVIGGMMDQTTILLGKKNHAIYIDFGNEERKYIPLKQHFFLFYTDVTHSHVSSEYNVRRKECEETLKIINEATGKNNQHLSEYSIADLEDVSLPDHLYKRVSFILEENDRVDQIAKGLKKGDPDYPGEILYQSHEGMSKKYEITDILIDWIVAELKKIPEVKGARMIGGGFGGCIIIQCDPDNLEKLEALSQSYNQQFHKQSYVIPAASGNSLEGYVL